MADLGEGLIKKISEQPDIDKAEEPERAGSPTVHQLQPRAGLSTPQAEQLLSVWGPNEIPKIETPLWKMLFKQFNGVMPYMLELSCIVSLIAGDYPDFGVILAMLVVNALLGFREEMKAKKALDELTNSMESTVTVLRDGKPLVLGVTHLVPGDVIHMRGGTMTPADVEWLEGDILSIDTAALTGEPIPRKYPSDEHGHFILSGCTVKAGEAYCIVRATGINTEIGKGQADIAADRSSASVSVFEQKVMRVVNIIISLAILDCIALMLVEGFVRGGFHGDATERKATLLVALSILIAAVPVALPLVMQVTMAIGAYHMAHDYHAIVTRMSALQDIASMDVLCSDKTGTLTTAKMSINLDLIWAAASQGFESLGFHDGEANQKQEILMALAYLASNPDKRDDAVDGAVIRAYEKMNAERGCAASDITNCYKQTQLTGFNPEVKRTVAKVQSQKTGQTLIVVKGLVTKVLDTSAGGEDAGELQWCCTEVKEQKDFESLVKGKDEQLAAAGYKTLAVAVGLEGGPMHFMGLLPMIDPPRSDTAKTVRRILDAGVEVKMITGDHLNIAIETARLVGMDTNILPGDMTREASYSRDELIRSAGGFAQVLPRDKREVVLVLQRSYDLVVGMTGDGVNDAPALSAAQCGIAVDDATDAAKGAAAMILTTEGLSAVFTAVVESRKIFNRLFSYISYRLASTIQILLYLSVLAYVFNCKLNPLYVILLALLNDVTMIPVAEDNQTASASPQHAAVSSLIGFSVMLGVMQSLASITYYLCLPLGGLVKNLDKTANFGYPGDTHAQNAIWLQVSISAELLIYVARSPGLFFLSRPALPLFVSTMLGNVISIVLAMYAFQDGLDGTEVAIIIGWDVAALFVVDFTKLLYKYTFEYSVSGIIDESKLAREDTQREGDPTQADDLRITIPVASTQASMRRSVATGSSLANSIADFLSTGKAPYSIGATDSAHGHAMPASSLRTPSLHRRTPGMIAQQRSFCNSVQRPLRNLHSI